VKIALLKRPLGFNVQLKDGPATIFLRPQVLHGQTPDGRVRKLQATFQLFAKSESEETAAKVSLESWKTEAEALTAFREGFLVSDPDDGKESRGRAIVKALLAQGLAEKVDG